MPGKKDFHVPALGHFRFSSQLPWHSASVISRLVCRIAVKSAFRAHDGAVSSSGMRMMRHRYSPQVIDGAMSVAISFLILLFALSALRASAEQLPVRIYTTADGLPRDLVVRIVRDSHGFLWFCTADGLSRFNGYEFTTYGVEQGDR